MSEDWIGPNLIPSNPTNLNISIKFVDEWVGFASHQSIDFHQIGWIDGIEMGSFDGIEMSLHPDQSIISHEFMDQIGDNSWIIENGIEWWIEYQAYKPTK